MRKLFFIFCLLVTADCVTAFAQDNAQATVMFSQYGNIKTSTVVTEEMTPPPRATRDEFLANTEIVAHTTLSKCKVTEFQFRILPNEDKVFLNYMVTGSRLTPEIIKLIKELKNPEARILIDGIKATCNGKEMAGVPIIIILSNNKK